MPEPDFTDFELIPDEALNLTVEEQAAAYEYPDGLVGAAEDDGLPFGRTIFMDWGAGRLNANQWVSGVDALAQVAQVALNVVRGTCPHLPDWFGRSGPDPQLGQTDASERRTLAQTDVRDTLLSCHERITDVRNFRWTSDPDQPSVDFEADVEVDGAVVTLVGGTLLV